ncbi:MAG: type I restriction endonuclease subunit R [bacterium]|nr:type I restriction endonuclease subunit R [bacterium]
MKEYITKYPRDSFIEPDYIQLFTSLGWEVKSCVNEFNDSGESFLGRKSGREVLLVQRMRLALRRLNPDLPEEAIELAIEELQRNRDTIGITRANRNIHLLLKERVTVSIQDYESGENISETVRIIDWNRPDNNDYFLAAGFRISSEIYTRQVDLLGFVNGIPLIFIELKSSHKRLINAYRENLLDYKNIIPHLFWYNAFIVLSNGFNSKVGSVSSSWEHFNEWKLSNKTRNSEEYPFENMVKTICDPLKMLDIIENYILFSEEKAGLVKLLAGNHQYFGVENAIRAFNNIQINRKLGIFWHALGSGKSYSIIFFAQKILRKISGNWTFLIVTDRKELDEQIYKNFARTGVLGEKNARAISGSHLKRLLQEDHRYIFTIINKFYAKKGETYSRLSNREDIIVIADEAFRSKYDSYAVNMMKALPGAAFIGFIGVPLRSGADKIRKIFGDYVSIYDFKNSVEDNTTVPLYYEDRIPELQLSSENFNEDMNRLLENGELSEDLERKLERDFAYEYSIVTHNERLERIAEDAVRHFMERGYMGKGIFIAIDKITTVIMFDKFQFYWKKYLDELKEKVAISSGEAASEIRKRIQYMEETDMAVVISASKNEVDRFKKKGLDIVSVRKRLLNENLDEKFKDPGSSLRIVFVCSRWITGFDVPICSTIYIDKPMRNHALVQAIARANRIFKEKHCGMVIDYVGVFRNLEKAFEIYNSSGFDESKIPIKQKSVLIEEFADSIEELETCCRELKIDIPGLLVSRNKKRVELIEEAVNEIIINDHSKRKYLSLMSIIEERYKAVLPDSSIDLFLPRYRLFTAIAFEICSLITSGYLKERTIAEYEHDDENDPGDNYSDFNTVDFERIKFQLDKGKGRIEAEKLRGAIAVKIKKMLLLNKSRMNIYTRFQETIDAYNSGNIGIAEYLDRLIDSARELLVEEKRAAIEGFSEEELALFDILTIPPIDMSEEEKSEVREIIINLGKTVREKNMILDWKKKQQARASIRLSVEEILDRLPRVFSTKVYQEKCDAVYGHIYDSYYGSGESIYESV